MLIAAAKNGRIELTEQDRWFVRDHVARNIQAFGPHRVLVASDPRKDRSTEITVAILKEDTTQALTPHMIEVAKSEIEAQLAARQVHATLVIARTRSLALSR